MTARRDWRHGCTKLVEMPPYGHMIVMQTDGARYEFYRRTGAAAPPRQPAMALTPTTR